MASKNVKTVSKNTPAVRAPFSIAEKRQKNREKAKFFGSQKVNST